MITFEKYLYSKTNNAVRDNTSCCGISKEQYPKWGGWKEVNKLRQVNKTDYDSEYLNVLVCNFYLVQYIASKLYL